MNETIEIIATAKHLKPTAKPLKELLASIQDTKITAALVVSDLGRLQPVTRIEATPNVVMLICRPRPDWAGDSKPEAPTKPLRSHDHEMTVKALHASEDRRKAEEQRISAQSGEWEKQEVAKAYAHTKAQNGAE